MAAAVTFVYADWVAWFPELAGISPSQAQGYFLRSGLYFANSTTNPAFADGNMTLLAYLLTAHIAWLSAPRDANGNPASAGQAPPMLVGRISSATEGSVSVSVELKGSGSPSEDWYSQTRYGLDFWQATAQYRTFRYVAQPVFVPSSIFPIGPPWGGWGGG